MSTQIEKWETLYNLISAHKVPEIIEKLKEYDGNFDINYKYYGMTPLFKAVEKNQVDVLLILLSYGANSNIVDWQNNTPLYYALINDNLEMFKILGNLRNLSAVADYYFDKALNYHRMDIAQYLLSFVDINLPDELGWTFLHLYAAREEIDIVKFLLDNGADINARTIDNETPLIFSVKTTSAVEAPKLLILYGCDISAVDNSGRDALYYAKSKNKTTLVEILENML